MTTITIDIPSAMWLSSNQRNHWREAARRTADMRAIAKHAAREAAPVAWPVNCDVSVGLPTARRFDPHNAAPSLKACLDGIVDAGVLPHDHGRQHQRRHVPSRPGAHTQRPLPPHDQIGAARMTEELYPDLPYSAREALWLIDGGVIPEEACARVGIQVASLDRILHRAGQPHPRVGQAAERVRDRQRGKAA